MTGLTVRALTQTVGAEVRGLDPSALGKDAGLDGELIELLEKFGVLVFPGTHLSPERQVAFCGQLGEVDFTNGNHEIPGIYTVSLDPAKAGRSASYLRGTFEWHVDGCTPDGDEYPQMATVLTAVQVSESGGETEFANSYTAYEALDEDEQSRLLGLRVVHSLEASQRRVTPDPSEKLLAIWRSRPTHEHPLVWTHRSGRRSLLIGASADYVVGMDVDEGRALLNDLLARATATDRVYRHEWSVGDTVIWDNRGVLHRAAPYDPASGREMLRTTILGDEPIQ
jgi:alpha-ketoglutarate-dependent taurine dioxygenase